MKLHEISQQFEVLEAIDLETYGDVEAYNELLKELNCSFETKVDNICMMIKNNEYESLGIQAEIDRLSARKKACDLKIDWYTKYLQREFERVGKEKLKTALFTAWIQKNRPSLKITNEEMVEAKYIKTKTEIDKSLLTDDIKKGMACDYAHLESSEGLRIK